MIETSHERFKTRPVKVANITIGGDALIVVQTMTTEKTPNIPAVSRQIIELHQKGAELVRVAVTNRREVKAIPNIKTVLKTTYQDVPLVADIQYQGSSLATEVAKTVDKVRINPGLFVYKKSTGTANYYTQEEIDAEMEVIDQSIRPVLQICKDRGVAIRIGVNHGSLSERLKVMYGDTPKGMVESAMEYLKICERNNFQDLVISLKSSNVKVMIEANRLMVQRMIEEGMNYPLHTGVTEAEAGQYGRIKGVVGIGTLLAEGIGDTIRVSLSEDPMNELSVCYDLLQSLGLRRTKMELIACPTCARTEYDLPAVLREVEKQMIHLKTLSIAVMGCDVNGQGEMRDADYGILGMGNKKVGIYRKDERIQGRIPQDLAVATLEELIKADNKWVDPEVKIRCSLLADEALKKALENYRSKKLL